MTGETAEQIDETAERLHRALLDADLRLVVKTGTGSDWGEFGTYDDQIRAVASALLRAGALRTEGGTPTTEHGVRWEDEPNAVEEHDTLDEARHVARQMQGIVVQRTVPAPGPWVDLPHPGPRPAPRTGSFAADSPGPRHFTDEEGR